MADARRILITGAAGFVGRHLVAALAPASSSGAAEVIACSLTGGAGHEALDVTDRDTVDALVRRTKPDCVVHLAAIAAPKAAGADPDMAWRVNVGGTLNVVQALKSHAPGARLVFAGSSEAYGASFKTAGEPLDETAPLCPTSVYGRSKAAADLALGRLARDGLNVVCFRPFNHTGPGQSTDFVVPAFAGRLAAIAAGAKAPLLPVGALDAERDFIDVRDVVRAYAMAALCDEVPPAGSVLNLASGTARSIRSILDSLIDLSQCHVDIRVDPAPVSATGVSRSVGNAALARRMLGWQPLIPFERTLRDVWQEHLAHARRAMARAFG